MNATSSTAGSTAGFWAPWTASSTCRSRCTASWSATRMLRRSFRPTPASIATANPSTGRRPAAGWDSIRSGATPSFRTDPRVQGAGLAAGSLGEAACRRTDRQRMEADRRGRMLHRPRTLPPPDRAKRPRGGGDVPRPVHSRREGEGLLLGRRISGAALQIGHPERRDADRLPVPAAGDRDARGRSRGDRPRRPGRIRLPPRPKGWPTPSSGSPTPKRSLASGRTWSGNASASRGGDVPAPAGGLCPDCKRAV